MSRTSPSDKRMLPANYEYPTNLWLGTSVENQEAASKRIHYLLQHTGAAVRFLSCEPLLGPVDIRKYLQPAAGGAKIDWVIIGGEAGPHSRAINPLWATSLIRQCEEAGTAVFFKQRGDHIPHSRVAGNSRRYRVIPVFRANGKTIPMVRVGKKAAGNLIRGRSWNEFPSTERAG